MKIQRLHLKNFRNVADETYTFDPHFTVIIGINGKGKSTWLNALRVACGAYLLSIPDAKSRHIEPNEIRFASEGTFVSSQTPVLVEAVGTFVDLKKPIEWRRRIPSGKIKTTSSNEDVGAIRDLGKMKYDAMLKGSDALDLPVIAYFGTSRAYGAARNRNLDTRIRRQIFKDGYHSWFEMRSTSYQYNSWLMSYDLMVKEGKEYPESKAAFFQALRIANPFIKDIEFSGTGLWLKVEMDGYTSETLPISLHSDGITSFTEMAAELAYRCIVLNGYKRNKSITDTQGVVMIDELDLHLHPNWQRHVVQDLKNAFPGIQFVATTHSPFIVQSLKREELINLDNLEGLETNPRNFGVEDVAEVEMGVKDIPRSEPFLEMVHTAEQYYQLIAEGKNSKTDQETAELRHKLNELEERYSDDAAFVALLKSERQAQKL